MNQNEAQVSELFNQAERNLVQLQRIQERLSDLKNLYDQDQLISYVSVNDLEHRSRIILKKIKEIRATISNLSDRIEHFDETFPDIVNELKFRSEIVDHTLPNSISLSTPLLFQVTFRNAGLETWDNLVWAETMVSNEGSSYEEVFTTSIPPGEEIVPGTMHAFEIEVGNLPSIDLYQVETYLTDGTYVFRPIFRGKIYGTN